MMRRIGVTLLLFIPVLYIYGTSVRLEEVGGIVGLTEKVISGYGIVVGLEGSGDRKASTLTKQMLLSYIENLGLRVENLKDINPQNSAVVLVVAKIQPFQKKGSKIDVEVNSIFDARSIKDGFLLKTLLKDFDGTTYAVASGKILTKGNERKVTTGYIPQGATVIEDYIPPFITNNKIYVYINIPGGNNIISLYNAITNLLEYTNGIRIVDLRTIEIDVSGVEDINSFVGSILGVEFEVDIPARVVLDTRSGVIVTGGNIKILPAVVTVGGLKIDVNNTGIYVYNEFEDKPIYYLSDVNDVEGFVQALKGMDIPVDKIGDILIALKRSGALNAEIIVY